MNQLSFKTKAAGLALLLSTSFISLKGQQQREIDDFNGIRAGDALKIIISQSDVTTLKVDAPSDIQPSVKTEVQDGILYISTDGNIKDDQNITVFITVKSLNSLENPGVADIKSENKLICDDITIISQGVGNIDLDLEAKKIKSTLSGAGHIILKGNTDLLDATISGAGGLKAIDLEATKVIAKVSGAGDAKVNAKESLNADVSGAGSIIYKGKPADRIVNISGVGSVRESESGTGEETASDTTKIKWGNRRYTIINNKDKLQKEYNNNFKYWRGINIGVNGFLNNQAGLTPPAGGEFLELNYAKSIQFGLNILQKNFHIISNFVNIYTGFGFDFNHYVFQKNVTLKSNTSFLMASIDSAIHYKKNKLNITYIKIPLMLEINTSRNYNHNFHIAVGAELDYRIFSVTKQIYELDDKHMKIKQKDPFHLEPFVYNAIARIGYNKVSIYASYGFTRLFKKDQAPQVYPFAAGITFTI